jgi:hypothetical protein
MNFSELLKKRGLDILLVVVVFTLFFISGSKESEENPEDHDVPVIDTASSLPSATQHTLQDTPAPNTRSPGIPQTKDIMPPSALTTQQRPSQLPPPATDFTPHPNPYQELRDSFKQVEGGAVTTEAIIERNTYFKKLSEQLRDLQGEVSTESTGSKPDANEVILSDDFPNQNDPARDVLEEDPEILDEILDEMELLQ